jgi:hypothetical protein
MAAQSIVKAPWWRAQKVQSISWFLCLMWALLIVFIRLTCIDSDMCNSCSLLVHLPAQLLERLPI